MLKENFEIIKSTFADYNGTGMYLAIYLIALLYIFICEKDKKIKTFTVYFSLIMLFVTLNPLFNKIVGKIFTKSIYWRMYWMLPIGLVIAYVVTKIIKDREKKFEKIVILLASITIIIVSGKLVYTKQNYIKVNNLYKIPNEAFEVTKIISEDNEETKKVMLPTTLVAYIRQIDSNIELMYSRQPSTYANIEILKELEQGNVEALTKQCKNKNCNYIIFNKATILNGNMEENDYKLFSQTENSAFY